MRKSLAAIFLWSALVSSDAADTRKPVPLCDGKTFQGWDGDTDKIWRVQEGAFVGGTLQTTVPRNEFLATNLYSSRSP